MNNYSPNMLKTFEQCPKKFFYKYVQKISIPQRSSLFEKGKKIHALANYYLQGQNIERMENSLNEDERQIWQTLKSTRYFNFEPIQTEYNLSCKIGEYWVGGRLDALMRSSGLPLTPNSSPSRGEGSMCYYILDYKTGAIPNNPQEDYQTIVYLLCVDKYLKSKNNQAESLQFVYLGLKKNQEMSILLTKELKKHYEQKILDICGKISLAVKSNSFQCVSEHCEKCEFRGICR